MQAITQALPIVTLVAVPGSATALIDKKISHIFFQKNSASHLFFRVGVYTATTIGVTYLIAVPVATALAVQILSFTIFCVTNYLLDNNDPRSAPVDPSNISDLEEHIQSIQEQSKDVAIENQELKERLNQMQAERNRELTLEEAIDCLTALTRKVCELMREKDF